MPPPPPHEVPRITATSTAKPPRPPGSPPPGCPTTTASPPEVGQVPVPRPRASPSPDPCPPMIADPFLNAAQTPGSDPMPPTTPAARRCIIRARVAPRRPAGAELSGGHRDRRPERLAPRVRLRHHPCRDPRRRRRPLCTEAEHFTLARTMDDDRPDRDDLSVTAVVSRAVETFATSTRLANPPLHRLTAVDVSPGGVSRTLEARADCVRMGAVDAHPRWSRRSRGRPVKPSA
jgi:hypothetical protein